MLRHGTGSKGINITRDGALDGTSEMTTEGVLVGRLEGSFDDSVGAFDKLGFRDGIEVGAIDGIEDGERDGN